MAKTVLLLLKNRLYMVLMSTFFKKSRKDGKPRGAGKIVLIGLLAVYLVACFFFLMGVMFATLAPDLIANGLSWLYFALAGIAAVLLSLFGSVFAAQSYIFDAKDNELLLSMPIKPGAILLSRLLMVLVLSYIYEMIVLIPAGIVYAMFAPFTPLMLTFFILGALVLPLLSVAVTCVLGWLIGLLTAKARRKNIITTVFMFVFIFAYIYFFMNLQNYLMSLIANSEGLAQSIRSYLAPFYNFGMAVGGGNVADFLLMLLWCMIPVALVYIIMSRSFARIITTNKGQVKIKYKEKAAKQKSPRMALLKKEISYFLNLPAYIFNCGIGAVFNILVGVFVIFSAKDLLFTLDEIMPGFSASAPLIMAAAIALLSSFNDVSAPSISLEGKTMWIIKSTPVKVFDVFFAKSLTNLAVSLPGIVFTAAVCWFVIPMNLFEGVMLVVLPALVCTFTGMLGLGVNLLCPRFDWVNEISVIKQSASVIISVMASMVFSAIPFGIALPLAMMSPIPGWAVMILCTLYFILLNVLCFLFLRFKGRSIYEAFDV